jgi:hypothetical protein
MIKDRAQKKLAAKFCAAQGIIPFVEVMIFAQTGLEEQPAAITDVDVLGLDLGRAGTVQRILFDCKTAAKQSGINRALWASGLKSLVHADRVFVIQKNDSPDTHKLAANTLDVHINSEDNFTRYAMAVAPNFAKNVTYLDDLDVWDRFLSLKKLQPALTDALLFLTTHAALELSGPRGVRTGLAFLLKVSGELDPMKPMHATLFRAYLSAILIFLSLSTSSLKDVFQFSMKKESFEQRLRYFVWEGREQYLNRRQMKAAIERAKGEAGPVEFDLPSWGQFVELMRSFLDAPEAIPSLAFLAKEIAFRTASNPKVEVDDHLRQYFHSNKRARQFIFGTASYLVNAAQLPKEFATNLESDINLLIDRAPSAALPKLL